MSRKNKPKHLPPKPFAIPRKEPKAARYVEQPRVFCTLNPTTFEVCVELPGPAGRRLVPLANVETLRAILMEQYRKADVMEATKIAEPSEPTEAQIKHWEEHAKRSQDTKLHSNCPFCIAEARHPVHRFDRHGKPIVPGVGNPEPLGI